MQTLPNKGTIYFLGIGGIGMSALARYFLSKGWKVSGYDKTRTSLTDTLQQEGMNIHYEEDLSLIPDEVNLVVYTPAVPDSHAEYRYFIQQGTRIVKRAELLGIIASAYKTIAIAGTHGKTTTSTMTAHLMFSSAKACIAFLGGISKNYETNLLLSTTTEYLVAEADEFDRSFLQLHPYIAVITSTDADHLDIYGSHASVLDSFTAFTGNILEGGILLLKAGLDLPLRLKPGCRVYRYGMLGEGDFQAVSPELRDGLYHFGFRYPGGVMEDMVLGLPGLYNVENAVAALAAAWLSGAGEQDLRSSLASFSGVMRRFDIRVKSGKLVYIDDYAHHPAELTASITAARAMFPVRKLTGIFQPHLFTRTRDFADEFARSLELLDEVILLPIYPAREQAIPGVSSQMLLEKIKLEHKQLLTKEEIPSGLALNGMELLMTLGAGDIDTLVTPIEKAIQQLV